MQRDRGRRVPVDKQKNCIFFFRGVFSACLLRYTRAHTLHTKQNTAPKVNSICISTRSSHTRVSLAGRRSLRLPASAIITQHNINAHTRYAKHDRYISTIQDTTDAHTLHTGTLKHAVGAHASHTQHDRYTKNNTIYRGQACTSYTQHRPVHPHN